MINGTKTSPMSVPSAPLKSVGRKLRPCPDELALRIDRQGVCAGNRKSLRL
jgi:hypothetical protein